METVDKFEKLKQWYETKIRADSEAKPLIEAEMVLRKEVVTLFFPESKEGTNTLALQNGWKLKYTKKLDYQVQQDVLAEVKDTLYSMNTPLDEIIKYKPSLSTSAYKTLRQLNPQACDLLDTALVVKLSSPTLELAQKKASK